MVIRSRWCQIRFGESQLNCEAQVANPCASCEIFNAFHGVSRTLAFTSVFANSTPLYQWTCGGGGSSCFTLWTWTWMVHEVLLLSCVAQRDTQCWKETTDETRLHPSRILGRIMLVVSESTCSGNRSVSTKPRHWTSRQTMYSVTKKFSVDRLSSLSNGVQNLEEQTTGLEQSTS